MKVIIDGYEYVKTEKPPDETSKAYDLLAEVYRKLHSEARYDPYNKHTEDFAEHLYEKMCEANKILRFCQ